MKQFKSFLIIISLTCTSLSSQSLLQSGPMVGYCEMREVMLWVQTSATAKVQFKYFDSTDVKRRWSTNIVQTTRDLAFTAHCLADSVQPGRTYFYELYLNAKLVKRPYPLRFKTPPLWQWRSDAPNFRIALGSCTYVNEERYDRPGEPYGAGYQVFTSIEKQQPDIMLWLGDNTYLREPDWNSRTGILHRYTHTRSLNQMQPLLAACANYAIWDDHDFGPNDCDRAFCHKEHTLNAFKLFWANQRYGMADADGGITSMFSYGDVDFFMMDNRWWRTPDKRRTGERWILGKQQFDWLIDNLASSTATFKIVCIGGQILNSVALFENSATYPQERQKLIETIHAEGISGVVFLSGDRHHSELSMIKEAGHYPLYDLTSSPLTSGPNPRGEGEPNTNRVSGTFVGVRNYATIDVTGTRDTRALIITEYDVDGKQLWQKTITLQEMKEK